MNKTNSILAYRDILPRIAQDVFIAQGAWVIGDVVIGERSSIWFNTVVRGDVHYIRIGSCTSVQDNSVLHPTGHLFPMNIGDHVLIGHNAVLHGCTIEDDCFIGIGSIILDGCKVGKGSVIAAGSLLAPGFVVPPESLVMGSPAKIKRKIGDNERAMIDRGWVHYVELAAEYFEAETASRRCQLARLQNRRARKTARPTEATGLPG
ncbi:MAG TPA: gamma carbonic anhydrase family protein [Deltaproteobacteria bacterium]|jgi:carbonic anhydrase/acetyltransferase-like protein (isoleucine patch superfamily)|nr:gamma carbonic anhydrase family protein [Deltaproteobacteria bacterium]HIJ75752.1 gamma carbonic anhydrase family protein [Deltaproteobacteria bacterium]